MHGLIRHIPMDVKIMDWLLGSLGHYFPICGGGDGVTFIRHLIAILGRMVWSERDRLESSTSLKRKLVTIFADHRSLYRIGTYSVNFCGKSEWAESPSEKVELRRISQILDNTPV